MDAHAEGRPVAGFCSLPFRLLLQRLMALAFLPVVIGLAPLYHLSPALAAQTEPFPTAPEIAPNTSPSPPEPVEPQLYPFAPDTPLWTPLEPGLELGRFLAGPSSSERAIEIVILRIDPAQFTFMVRSGSDPAVSLLPNGAAARSLQAWAQESGFVAVINAGMYLPDGLTNTGYLRVGSHLNNHRLVGRFGAFFVTGKMVGEKPATLRGATPGEAAPQGVVLPDAALLEAALPEAALPEAALLDRTQSNWEETLPWYSMVVQNYRMLSANRKNLWQPGGPEHSISAVGTDGTGHLLFIHCREPLTGLSFGNLLLAIPADIRTVMYVEGGSQAGLLLDTPALNHIWMGRHPADFWTDGNIDTPLPNVIGIRRKTQQPSQQLGARSQQP